MFRRLLREYLSLTHGERRGLQILSILVILLVLFRASLPLLTEPEGIDFSGTAEDFLLFQDSLRDVIPIATGELHEPFLFDPNTIELDELLLMGVSPRVARTLLNYRTAGGTFDTDSGLLKVYGLSSRVFQRLQPYIRIAKTGNSSGFHSNPARSTPSQSTPVQSTPVPLYPDSAVTVFHNAVRQNSGRQQQSRLDWADSLAPGYFTGLQPFELNLADSMQLLSVYGIGPIFARRIIRYRDLLGGFYRHEQLDEVYGFTLQQHRELSRRSYIDTSLLRKINLNDQDAAGLSSHPYINFYQAAALVSYRDQMGRYMDPLQVIENHLLPDSVFLRILPYLYTGQ